MNNLENILTKYHDAHQISATVNILDIAKSSCIPVNNNFTKCVCEYLQPNEGWNRFVTKSSSKNDKCYYCRLQLSKKYPSFNINSQCANCYMFMCKEYTSVNSEIRLTDKFIRKNKIR